MHSFRTCSYCLIYLHTRTVNYRVRLSHITYNDIDIFLRSNDEKILYNAMSREKWNPWKHGRVQLCGCSQPIFLVNTSNHNCSVRTRSHATKPVLRWLCKSHVYLYLQFPKLEKIIGSYLIHSLQILLLMAVREIVSLEMKQ